MIERIFENLDYEPLRGQILLVNALGAFVENRGPRDVFVLNGYAGTGKTSIVGALIKALRQAETNVVLLAPTGRAAKVASGFAGHPASTIHKRLFRVASPGIGGGFIPVPNLDRNTVFIVDEASLITDNPSSGRSLLKQLIDHVYSSERCNMILVGDTAQLPPVGQPDSPAMNRERLRSLGLEPFGFTLEEPVRQKKESGILRIAEAVRRDGLRLAQGAKVAPPKFKLSGFSDIGAISSADMLDELSTSWNEVGIEETLLITRSNKRANLVNRSIRSGVMMVEEPLERGDRIIVAKNDYYWSKQNKLDQFLANGETAVIDWVGRTEKKYGRYFTEAEMTLPSTGEKLSAKIHLRSLVSEGPSIPEEEMNRFYNRVLAEQEGEALSDKIKAASSDPYFNALQAKYGYCITCHKAQGGQWKHVYIDMGGIDTSALTPDFYRWLYTALTRATEKVFLVNPTIDIV